MRNKLSKHALSPCHLIKGVEGANSFYPVLMQYAFVPMASAFEGENADATTRSTPVQTLMLW